MAVCQKPLSNSKHVLLAEPMYLLKVQTSCAALVCLHLNSGIIIKCVWAWVPAAPLFLLCFPPSSLRLKAWRSSWAVEAGVPLALLAILMKRCSLCNFSHYEVGTLGKTVMDTAMTAITFGDGSRFVGALDNTERGLELCESSVEEVRAQVGKTRR